MNPISFKVRLFDDWEINNPFWVASGHYSDSDRSLQGWDSFRPAAITLKTTAPGLKIRPHAPGLQFRRHIDPCRGNLPGLRDRGKLSPNLYCDGEPKDEYLSLDYTRKLLDFSREKLPYTKVGISIMMEEDYAEAAKHLKGAHFAELNLKYAARLSNAADSWFAAHGNKLQYIIGMMHDFCAAFSDIPLFIKLTRELPWLLPSSEFSLFLQAIRDEMASGRRVGLVMANTRKLRIPANLVSDTVKEELQGLEQVGGILAGEHLYIETYNIIRELMEHYKKDLNGIPIVATGGITSLASFIEVVHAGATAAQILTAFESYGYQHYGHLRQDLAELIRTSKKNSYMELVGRIQGASPEIREIRFHAQDIPARNRATLARQLREKLPELIAYMLAQTQSEIQAVCSDNDLQQALAFGDRRLTYAKEVGLPSLNSEHVQQARAPSFQIGIASARSNLTTRIFIKLLQRIESYYGDNVLDTNRALVQKLTSGEDWDLAIVTEPCLKELCDKQKEDRSRPIVLGHLLTTSYYLCGSWDINPNLPADVELYYFGGRESDFALDVLSLKLPNRLKRMTVTFEELIFWLNRAGRYDLFLAKDPLCTAYLAIRGDPQMIRRLSAAMRSYLLLSGGFLERAGTEVVCQVYADLTLAKKRAPEQLTWPFFFRDFESEVKELWKIYLHIPLA